MLVLTRRVGEQLVIANNIVVTVLLVEGNKVRIGIEAPISVRVDRAEVHHRRITNREADDLALNEIDTGCPIG